METGSGITGHFLPTDIIIAVTTGIVSTEGAILIHINMQSVTGRVETTIITGLYLPVTRL